MIQQVSDSELELMKIIWENGGMALYANIMEKLAQTGRTWQKKYGHDSSFTSRGKRIIKNEQNRAEK